MRTLDDALNQFAYHPATAEVAPIFGTLRDVTMAFARETWALIPDGPEKTLAYRGLQQFLMHANLAVAMTTPADLTNQAVARVLPENTRDNDDWRCTDCGEEYAKEFVKIMVPGVNGPICQSCAVKREARRRDHEARTAYDS